MEVYREDVTVTPDEEGHVRVDLDLTRLINRALIIGFVVGMVVANVSWVIVQIIRNLGG